jgi:hypothetical protein
LFVCIGRRVYCRGERRWLMTRKEARHPATENGPWNSLGADRFESECRHGLSDPMWCNICSQDPARRETVKAQGHELPWSQGS